MLSPTRATSTLAFVVRPSLARWRPVLLALPLTGLGLLLVRPELNIEWHHHPSHFWLVLTSAAVSVALAYVTNIAAGRHRDARVKLVSLAFLASAGFLGLHALATPGILIPTRNVGFMIATPVGLIIGSGFALASVSRLAGPRADLIQRHGGKILAALVGAMVVWAAASLAGLGPLGAISSMSHAPMIMEGMPGMDGMPAVQPAPSMDETGGPLVVLAIVAIAAYAIAAWRYLTIHRERGGILPLATGAAFALLAEATVAVVLSHNWEMTWWAWHLLMLVAFASFYGSLALLVGCWRLERRIAMAVPGGLALAGWLINSLAAVATWLEPVRAMSPLWWFTRTNPLRDGLDTGGFSLLAAGAMLFTAAALRVFDRRDLA